MSTVPHFFKMQRVWSTGLVIAGCQMLIACGSLGASGTAPTFRDPRMSMQAAHDAIVVGKTTQAEALAALGPAIEIRFDSGNAVWAYRTRSAEPGVDSAEFIVLFAPSGIVKKTRLRSAHTTTNE